MSQYTSPSPSSEKCVACHPGSQVLTLKPHFTCFKKGKVHSHLTPPRCLKRHSSSFKYEKVSNSQPTQQTRYIQELEGPWQVYEWGREGIVVWVQVIPGQGRSQPRAGTRSPCCTSTNEYSQPTMNTQNVNIPKSYKAIV